ncbi:MAG: MarR family winged helix-turn-helix transcriptional regulator [Thermoleophilaceae bacterium]
MAVQPTSQESAGPAAPAAEAWSLMLELSFSTNKPRLMAISQEYDLTPMQLHALRALEPGLELTMSALAGSLFCDASNVTGIVDRLEDRGLIERRSAAHDRRVKMLTVTEEGARLREEVVERLSDPPPWIAALPRADQRALRDVLRKAAGSRTPAKAPAGA